MRNIARVGFSFSVSVPLECSGTPVSKTVLNTFDFLGDMLSIERLPGERNPEFKQRIMDICVNPGGSSYVGVINNLVRDFGYSRDHALTIELKLDSAGQNIARNPRVDILANRVVLYSDWRPDGTATIDKEIRTYQPTDDGYFLEDLISKINESTCFSATIHEDARPNMHSSNLIRGTSDFTVYNDTIKADKRTILSSTNLVEGTLVFLERDVFVTEVESDPDSDGEYSVDRQGGVIENYSMPSGKYGVSYRCGLFPMIVDYAPITLYTLNDDDFVNELFMLETLESSETARRLPNTEGSEIIHQLFKETKVFWGV